MTRSRRLYTSLGIIALSLGFTYIPLPDFQPESREILPKFPRQKVQMSHGASVHKVRE